MKTLRLVALAAIALCAFAVPAQAKLVHFKTPSGNINCIGLSTGPQTPFVQCLVKSNTWVAKPVRPANCDLDFDPFELQLQSRKVTVGACRGDVGPLCFKDCFTLKYGKFTDIGAIRCISAAVGVTCRYKTPKRAGFRISRQGFFVYHI